MLTWNPSRRYLNERIQVATNVTPLQDNIRLFLSSQQTIPPVLSMGLTLSMKAFSFSASGEPAERAKKAVSIKETKMNMSEGFFFGWIVRKNERPQNCEL